MTYKEIVDDILLIFKEYNESRDDISPYWIAWKVFTESTILRDLELSGIEDMEDVPDWMLRNSDVLNATMVNSGDTSLVVDPDLSFAKFTIGETYSSPFLSGLKSAFPLMRQTKSFEENINDLMLRIRAESESLKHYLYFYREGESLYMYPYTPQIKVRYIPFLSLEQNQMDLTSEYDFPARYLVDVKKLIKDDLILEKQMVTDNTPDKIDADSNSTQ